MIEDDTYCPEVVQQIDSVIGLLKSTRMTLITGHLNTCLESHLHDQKEQTIDELLKMYKL
jgi:DNA-binding FrmR family transcriptional regulator